MLGDMHQSMYITQQLLSQCLINLSDKIVRYLCVHNSDKHTFMTYVFTQLLVREKWL